MFEREMNKGYEGVRAKDNAPLPNQKEIIYKSH